MNGEWAADVGGSPSSLLVVCLEPLQGLEGAPASIRWRGWGDRLTPPPYACEREGGVGDAFRCC